MSKGMVQGNHLSFTERKAKARRWGRQGISRVCRRSQKRKNPHRHSYVAWFRAVPFFYASPPQHRRLVGRSDMPPEFREWRSGVEKSREKFTEKRLEQEWSSCRRLIPSFRGRSNESSPWMNRLGCFWQVLGLTRAAASLCRANKVHGPSFTFQNTDCDSEGQ